jgi:hypothetical protein
MPTHAAGRSMMLPSHRKQNPGDSFRRQSESRRRAYAEARSLRERFPSVEEVVADLAFIDGKRLGIHSGQLRKSSASAKAFFCIACPRALCLGGGFDLDAVIAEMIMTGNPAAAGIVECVGWLDPQCEHTRCLLKLSYRIDLRYAAKPTSFRHTE